MSTPSGKAGNAGKLENEPFLEFGWKSRKAIGFSPALAGKAGNIFLGLVIFNGSIR